MPPATTSAQALSNLQNFQGHMQSADQIVSGTEQGLGIPQAQQQVSGLRQAITNTTNLLNQVAPSVYGRTQNSLVTDAQATKQISNEQAPLNTTLSKENTDLGNQSSDLSNLLSRAAALEQLKETGQENQLSNLENIYKDLSANEQAAAAQKLEQQKLAEQIREANLSSASSRGGGGGSGRTPAPTAQNVTAALRSQISNNHLIGGDGHVSPSTLASMYNTWEAYGLGDKAFWAAFQGLWNPKQRNYGQQFSQARAAGR